ncbi:MAG TPA: purine-nucleoside phosphorylase, partial [Eubacteriales bacterium]|nr:purine-nucleoside phosphorylase [Eubacteriales bacterium]
KVRDIVLAETALTRSSFAENFGLPKDFLATASPELLAAAQEIAEKTAGDRAVTGRVFSSDVFYGEGGMADYFKENGILAVEMEAAALYMNAYKAGKRALAILTISDSLVTHQALSAEDRQSSFKEMMYIALELALNIRN